MNTQTPVAAYPVQFHTAEDSKFNSIPEPFADLQEIHDLFYTWISQQNDQDYVDSLMLKLERLSLNAPTLTAVLLFLLYPEAKDLPQNVRIRFLDETALYLQIVKVHQFPTCPKDKPQEELTLKMLFAVLSDVQLLAAYLVLQLQQLEFKQNLSAEIQDAKARTALQVHAPIAGRLGIFWIKAELEDRAFQQLEPEKYQELKQMVSRKSSDRAQKVENINSKIESLLKNAGITHETKGRYKRFYSIFQKLAKVENDFDRIQDLTAFRILVKRIDQCYAALSYIHECWSPIDNRFKDYITNPKPNGYQSLHTTVMDEDGEPIEIQIRTYKMHKMAEHGVAAHWLYKEKRHINNGKKVEQMEQDMSQRKSDSDAGDSIPQIELFNNKIYVMTPNKEIRELNQDATPVDFAYAIHTQVGNRLTGAKVNGSIIRIDTPLCSGDVVEILTSPRQEPKKEWLEYAVTRHARSKIKHALQEKNREARRKEGIELLEREFKNHSLNLNRLTREGRMEQESKNRKNQEFEHILFCVGEGSIKADEVRKWFMEEELTDPSIKPELFEIIDTNPVQTRQKTEHHGLKSMIIVSGVDNVMTRIAKCCAPEKGTPIQGYLTQERVITVHRTDCTSLSELHEERMIEVLWNEE